MRVSIIVILIATLTSATLAVVYNNYVQLNDKYKKLEVELSTRTALKNSYLNEVKLLHQIDAKRTQELNHAKAEITRLTDDLHNGTKRLYVKAVCEKSDSITTPTTRMDVARPTQLAADAERSYLRLRRQIETLEAQFLGLRERINTIYKQKEDEKNRS